MRNGDGGGGEAVRKAGNIDNTTANVKEKKRREKRNDVLMSLDG